ncbi:hypothetical protein CEXT_162631 [Caerostris extrusa]|uniref:Uncharacterized protein n=1 Tax=Caerostris extrusa TaxID=172846 RepID=A0AAV4N393_CAEEX|nr:hypothetical protein CEXT_162631 [Caerostris extrusa]
MPDYHGFQHTDIIKCSDMNSVSYKIDSYCISLMEEVRSGYMAVMVALLLRIRMTTASPFDIPSDFISNLRIDFSGFFEKKRKLALKNGNRQNLMKSTEYKCIFLEGVRRQVNMEVTVFSGYWVQKYRKSKNTA